MTTDLKSDIETIIDELKFNTNIIKTVMHLAKLAIDDAETNMDQITESMDADKVNKSIEHLTEAQGFINSIGLKTPKFDTLIDDLDSIRFQIKNKE